MKRQVIFLGDQGTGKTSILKKMINNTAFSHDYHATIGIDIQFLEHNEYKFRLLDLSGQERFRFMVSHCLVNTDVIVLVCDANNIESIKHLDDWRDLIAAIDRDIPVITVINKCDLVHINELKKVADKFSSDKLPFIQVSAENGDNILSICDLIEATLNLDNNEKSFYGFFSFESQRADYISPDEESAQSTYSCSVM